MFQSMKFSLCCKVLFTFSLYWTPLSSAQTTTKNAEVLHNDTSYIWQRWEHTLTSVCDYNNPCKDVKVYVQFEGPNGQRHHGLGFWDGQKLFRIRGVFPAIGKWQWETTCSDETNRGLHGQSGTIDVKITKSDNSLIQHGYPKVSDDGRLLIHPDGMPFLWIGDTCWAALVNASEEEWNRYVDNRSAKGYSVLQLSIAPGWALEKSRLGIPPFLSTLPDITKPNPQFFQEMDKKLAIANDRGLVIMMCGLMETPYEYPPMEQIALFSQYVAARYRSYAVIFSPSFDAGIHEAEMLASANAIHAAAPQNLITMHMGTGVGPYFHTADWLSFDMYQSGHNGGNKARQSDRAVNMPAEILSLSPRKPIINGEAIYEGDLGGAFDVRRTAWLSFLSGAVGYTAGINELFQWKEDVITKMNLPSSDQIGLLARILRTMPWWELKPQPKRILNQPDDWSRVMAFAMTENKGLGIAYLPVNDRIEVDLTGFLPKYHTLWINPASGQWLDGTDIISLPKNTLSVPDRKDWILVFASVDSQEIVQIKKALTENVPAKPKLTASIVFTKDAVFDGLVLKEPADGVFTRQTYKDVECIVNKNPKRNQYLYLDLDDRLAFRGGLSRMNVELRAQSKDPLDTIQLQYDAVDSRYKSVLPSWRKQQDGWAVVGFVAEAPYLGNRQNSGADFRIFLGGQLCNISSLQVKINGDS